MLESVNLHVETLEYRLSSKLFRGSVNNLLGVVDSQPHCEGLLTGREEVFYLHSLHNVSRSTTSNLLEGRHDE